VSPASTMGFGSQSPRQSEASVKASRVKIVSAPGACTILIKSTHPQVRIRKGVQGVRNRRIMVKRVKYDADPLRPKRQSSQFDRKTKAQD